MDVPTVLYRSGSTEYIGGVVTADALIGSQPVALSVDGGDSWMSASWVGQETVDSATGLHSREVQVLVDVSLTFPEPGPYTILCKVVDDPETVIVPLGNLSIR